MRITEHVNIEPALEIFNLFNKSNYSVFDTVLDGSIGQANGTSSYLAWGSRLGFGSGSFSPGTQRAFQFGFRVNF